jgi:hypothetical protein
MLADRSLSNIGTDLSNYKASQPRRQLSSISNWMNILSKKKTKTQTCTISLFLKFIIDINSKNLNVTKKL